jgi:hypothetical protein
MSNNVVAFGWGYRWGRFALLAIFPDNSETEIDASHDERYIVRRMQTLNRQLSFHRRNHHAEN